MRAAPLALLAPLLLAGCAAPMEPCPLVVHTAMRTIDDGFRYDVDRMDVDPIGLDEVGYRFTNQTEAGPVRVHQGNLLELADQAGANATLRFLDDEPRALLDVGDAFVLRGASALTLELVRDGNIIGGTGTCL